MLINLAGCEYANMFISIDVWLLCARAFAALVERFAQKCIITHSPGLLPVALKEKPGVMQFVAQTNTREPAQPLHGPSADMSQQSVSLAALDSTISLSILSRAYNYQPCYRKTISKLQSEVRIRPSFFSCWIIQWLLHIRRGEVGKKSLTLTAGTSTRTERHRCPSK